MKNKNYLYILGFVLIASCSADPELAPIISVDNAQIGAFPRTVNLMTAEYDLMDLTGSSYLHDIDFRSEDNGQNVDAYNVYVTFDDNDPANGDDSSSEVLLQSYGQSDFSDGPDGNRAITLDFPFTQVATATGVALDAVSPGDKFDFRAELILSDGRKFEQRNTESTIFGPAFRAFFDWSVNATCPLSDDNFSGNYQVTFPNTAGTGYGLPFDEQVVNIRTVAGSSTRREFDVLYLPEIGPFGPYPFEFDFVCDVAQFTQLVAGVSCQGGNITVGPVFDADGNIKNAPVRLADDSTFDLYIDEGYVTTGCASLSTTETLVRFTKQ